MLQLVGNIANRILAGLDDGTLPTAYRFECWECFNSGFRSVQDLKHSHYSGVVRCDRCEYWNFRRKAGRMEF